MKKNMSSDNNIYFTINQVAKKLDVVPATIRNWEKQGLFVAKRKGNNYRIYDFNDIEVLEKIKTYSIEENINMATIKKLVANDMKTVEFSKQEYLKSHSNKKIKDYRKKYDYTLEEVARAIDISPSYLSKIEQNKADISLDIMEKILEFYGESILSFFDYNDEKSKVVIKSGKGESVKNLLEGVETKKLNSLSDIFDIVMFTVAPGCGDFKSHKHASGSEYIYILKGKLQLTVDDDSEYLAKEGDSVQFESTSMHKWHNAGKNSLQMIWVHSSI